MVDDNEPVTSGWLKKIGWEGQPDTPIMHYRISLFCTPKDRATFPTAFGMAIGCGYGWSVMAPTRGDVRRVFAAMKIELKEPKYAEDKDDIEAAGWLPCGTRTDTLSGYVSVKYGRLNGSAAVTGMGRTLAEALNNIRATVGLPTREVA